MVAFRNNSAYSRWWEGRTLWGQIVNSSRSLARQVCVSLNAEPEMAAVRRKIIYYQIAFVHALRQQLRDLDPVPEIRPLLTDHELAGIDTAKNIPLALQQRMGEMVRDARARGWIDSMEWNGMPWTAHCTT
ncbi:MAG: bestrophin family ion channel [Bryobacteraceae bacterium]